MPNIDKTIAFVRGLLRAGWRPKRDEVKRHLAAELAWDASVGHRIFAAVATGAESVRLLPAEYPSARDICVVAPGDISVIKLAELGPEASIPEPISCRVERIDEHRRIAVIPPSIPWEQRKAIQAWMELHLDRVIDRA